jgi:hypothetical protein
MLSAEERRQLDGIERLLQVHDPDFVALMRAGRRPRRWVPVLLHGLMWTVAFTLGVAVGWLIGVAAAAIAGVVAASAGIRRSRRQRIDWESVAAEHSRRPPTR